MQGIQEKKENRGTCEGGVEEIERGAGDKRRDRGGHRRKNKRMGTLDRGGSRRREDQRC